MDFRHLIVTCLFSKLRLPFDNQKVKENYAILWGKTSGCCGYSVSMSNLYSPYLFNSTSKLAASRQVKRNTVCFLSADTTLQ